MDVSSEESRICDKGGGEHRDNQNCCLTCGEKLPRPELTLGDAYRNNLVEKISTQRFRNLCDALRLTVTKCQGWNFEKEMLPLCRTCSGIADRLGTIVEQVKNLETEYSARIVELKTLISTVVDGKSKTSGQSGDDRILNFRKLVFPTTSKLDSCDNSILFRGRPNLDSILASNYENLEKSSVSVSPTDVLSSGKAVKPGRKRRRPEIRNVLSPQTKKKRVATKSSKLPKKKSHNLSMDFVSFSPPNDDNQDNDNMMDVIIKQEDFGFDNEFPPEFLLLPASDPLSSLNDERLDPSQKLDIELKEEVDPLMQLLQEVPQNKKGPKVKTSRPPLASKKARKSTPAVHAVRKSNRKSIPVCREVKTVVSTSVPAAKTTPRRPASPNTLERLAYMRSLPRRPFVSDSSVSSSSEEDDDPNPRTSRKDPDFDIRQEREKLAKWKRKSNRAKTKASEEKNGEEEEIQQEIESDSDSEMEGHVAEAYNKWKYDEKAGRMWYDGVEVTPHPTGLQCSICFHIALGDKGTKNKGRIKTHINHYHLTDFRCNICSKKLATEKNLAAHVLSVHERAVNIPCDICDKPFTTRTAMLRHRWSHQNEDEVKAALAAGLKRKSNKPPTLQCQICGKLCKGQTSLNKHEETHLHPDERPKFTCHICGSAYSSEETLRRHLKLTHTQLQNRFPCTHCDKRFPEACRLQRHMLSHTAEKAFSCDVCGKRYALKSQLKVHLMRHKNIRPHGCPHCEMAFLRAHHLRKHINSYHVGKPWKIKLPMRGLDANRKQVTIRKPSPQRNRSLNMNDYIRADPSTPNNNSYPQLMQEGENLGGFVASGGEGGVDLLSSLYAVSSTAASSIQQRFFN
ncbi:zinc finger protein 560 [Folsomia candida]|uniref:zinc finger protein 560 n=1 Tax=Folsomia candida TaxID=158441 RepID=UPI000B8F7367|nr:zinc finger protein 560 [Folsomia candida]XP_035701330.1 zinc finger protein 560 [Folsomia candida]